MTKRAFIGAMPLMLAASASGAIVFLIDDQEMSASNWNTTVVNQFGGFTGFAGHAAGGGNPGAYRTIFHSSATSPAAGWLEHVHIQTWTPSVQGEIVSLDMGVDVNCFDGGTSGAVLFGLIIVQDGSTFFGPTYTPLSNSGWRSDLHQTGLISSDFTDAASAHPDFSENGATLSFGIYSSNGTVSGIPISSSSGADNFNVVLNFVCLGDIAPAPGGDSTVGVADLLAVINTWGPCPQPPASCVADINQDGAVSVPDLLVVANNWGLCP